MSNPFAAIESAINSVSLSALGNATANIAGVLVNGMFDKPYMTPLGMSNSAPSFIALDSDVESVAVGDSLTISGDTWTVREIQPDGRGMTALMLEAA